MFFRNLPMTSQGMEIQTTFVCVYIYLEMRERRKEKREKWREEEGEGKRVKELRSVCAKTWKRISTILTNFRIFQNFPGACTVCSAPIPPHQVASASTRGLREAKPKHRLLPGAQLRLRASPVRVRGGYHFLAPLVARRRYLPELPQPQYGRAQNRP